MQQSPRSTLQAANPLIKLVREREDLFFQLFHFVNQHLQASSNDLDGLTVFNKFLLTVNSSHRGQLEKEQQFLKSFPDVSQQPIPKQLMRLTMRLIELLESSLARLRKSVFEESGRASKEFSRFKLIFQKMMKKGTFSLRTYADHVLSYCTVKYLKQVAKVQRYVERVGQGEDICLRDIYHKENSDVQSSPDQRKQTVITKPVRKIVHKVQKWQGEHFSSADDQDFKVPVKKVMKPTIKRRQKPLHIKNKANEEQDGNSKQQTANKLLKFYALLQLNKKQFLEDYVYDKLEEEKHKHDLIEKLLQRNKQINRQINNYVKKSSACIPKIIISAPANQSSGDQRNESTASKLSLRTSFVISKRKTSFHLQNSGTEKTSQGQNKEVTEMTIKNINPRRRSSHSNHRPHLQEKSKRLFVVKSPMMFEDDVIPQAQITHTQWLGVPLTNKGRDHKHDNIRLKRKNNPNPMENAFLPQAFHYPI